MSNKKKYIEQFNFRWMSGIDYDYNYSYPCDSSCNDGYCRCGVVGGLNYITIDTESLSKEICEKIEDISTVERYCIGRIITSFKLWETERWEISSSSGYYGEEVDGIDFDQSIQLNQAINNMLAYSEDIDKIRFVLELEYDSILPMEGMTSARVNEVNYSSLRAGNDPYARMIKKGEVDFVKLNDEIPIGVYRKDGDVYVLIDGYHRFTKAGLEKKEKVKIVVLSPLERQVDN